MRTTGGNKPELSREGIVFVAPGLRMERTQDCGPVTVSGFERESGEGAWFNHRHRLVLPLSDLGPVEYCLDKGRWERVASWTQAMAFYPAQTHV